MDSRVANSDSRQTSLSLIMRVQTGDQDAWRRVSSIYGPMIYSWSRQAGLQSSDAADIGQEVFRSVTASIDKFQVSEQKGSFRGWLWSITRNKIYDHFRKNSDEPDGVGGSAANQLLQQLPEQLSSQGDVSELSRVSFRLLEQVQSEFEPTTWQAFWRSTIEGDAVIDIAEDLGISKWTVYKAKSRVLTRLRKNLSDLGEVQ